MADGNMSVHKERERRRDALFKVLHEFGLPEEHGVWIYSRVNSIVRWAVAGTFTEIRAIKRGKEKKRLQRMKVLAQKLARELREMNPEVLYGIDEACYSTITTALPRLNRISWSAEGGREVKEEYICPHLDGEFWELFWETVGRLDRVIDQITPKVNRHIDATPEAGRRHTKNVEAIRRLLLLWMDALNKDGAPLSINDASEFSEFLAESFKALGLKGNHRAAMDSWRAYCRENPNDGWND
jgi:hypothetical protein